MRRFPGAARPHPLAPDPPRRQTVAARAMHRSGSTARRSTGGANSTASSRSTRIGSPSRCAKASTPCCSTWAAPTKAGPSASAWLTPTVCRSRPGSPTSPKRAQSWQVYGRSAASAGVDGGGWKDDPPQPNLCRKLCRELYRQRWRQSSRQSFYSSHTTRRERRVSPLQLARPVGPDAVRDVPRHRCRVRPGASRWGQPVGPDVPVFGKGLDLAETGSMLSSSPPITHAEGSAEDAIIRSAAARRACLRQPAFQNLRWSTCRSSRRPQVLLHRS